MRPILMLCLALSACGQAPAPPRAAAAIPGADCAAAKKHGRLEEARACYTRLSQSTDPWSKAEGLWALRQYFPANDAFRAAVAGKPDVPEIHVRWGRMFLERAQPGDAAKEFEAALGIEKDFAPALLGQALILAERFSPGASEMARKALAADPKLVEAQELLARIELENNEREKAAAEAGKALALSSEALDAMAVNATIDMMSDRNPSPWMDRILKVNPNYGTAYALAGHLFVINRRYEEGIAAYRKALELDPTLWDARSELGVNLMRLGREDEARQLLEKVYNDGLSTEPVRNTLKLMDTYKNFVTFKTPKTVLRLNRKEAELLRPYFQAELDRALATYEKKYKVKIDQPVQVEVYPNHEDFAVRTMGLPGLGALGVTFGTVVAMDSPSGRKPGEWHWASTMWHELSHVYVLTATKHRVPRWFTEGLAVHEETAVSPDWGDRLSTEVIKAIEGKKLLPIADLDQGFVHPTYPAQVVVSYYQAGKICDYIKETYGYERLLEMMHMFAGSRTTPDVVEAKLGMKPEEFDRKFLAWLDGQTKKTVAGYADWRKRVRGMTQALEAKSYDDVIAEGNAIRDIYPDYVDHSSVYELLAAAYKAKNDSAAARRQLEAYANAGGRSPETLKRLATLQEEAGDKKAAAITLDRLMYIYPLDEDAHRRLGELYLALGNNEGSIREFEAVVNSKPVDQAGAHFALARAYKGAGKIEKAKDEVLLALEAAPGYKPAQWLLLELDGKD